MGVVHKALSALQRIGIVVLIAIAFLFGLGTTVYLSLRSAEVTVPEVVGKHRFDAERILENADLNFRVRATRPSNEVKADTVLFQLPRAGEVVKVGQTVAMDISRRAKEGEATEASVNDKKASEEKGAENRNADESANGNENESRPTRNKNTNKNANANANGDHNVEHRNSNADIRNANANTAATRPPIDANTVNANANGSAVIDNLNASRNSNQNANRPVAPKPSPTSQNSNLKNP